MIVSVLIFVRNPKYKIMTFLDALIRSVFQESMTILDYSKCEACKNVKIQVSLVLNKTLHLKCWLITLFPTIVAMIVE